MLGGVTESVKDSRPASFLKTLPSQSGLLLCILSIRDGKVRLFYFMVPALRPGRRPCGSTSIICEGHVPF